MTITINGTDGITTPEVTLDNTSADGGQVVLKSSGYSNWNLDNYSGRIRAYYGSTEYFTINSSGNVGIGTSSPVSLGSGYGTLDIRGSNGSGFRWGNSTDSTYTYADSTSTVISTATSKPLTFGTNNTERARIDSSGNLLVNASSSPDSTCKLQLGGNSSTMRFIPTVDNTGYVGQSTHRWAAIYAANGTIQTSDGREKNTIEDSVLGLEFVKALRPVSYKWNVGENVVTYDEEGNQVVTPRAGTRTHFGFIAQEVKEVIGDQDFGGYVEEPNGRLGLRYDQFISPLVKAIQEQQAIIESLKTRIETLENK